MTTYTTRVVVPANRRITVELPEDMPLGEAEVTVCAEAAPAADSRFSTTGEKLLEGLRNRPPFPPGYVPRTREEIDAEINAMRDEWEPHPIDAV